MSVLSLTLPGSPSVALTTTIVGLSVASAEATTALSLRANGNAAPPWPRRSTCSAIEISSSTESLGSGPKISRWASRSSRGIRSSPAVSLAAPILMIAGASRPSTWVISTHRLRRARERRGASGLPHALGVTGGWPWRASSRCEPRAVSQGWALDRAWVPYRRVAGARGMDEDSGPCRAWAPGQFQPGAPSRSPRRASGPTRAAASGRSRHAASGRSRGGASGRSRHAASGRSRGGASGRSRHAASGRYRAGAWGRYRAGAWDRCSPSAWDRYRSGASGPYRGEAPGRPPAWASDWSPCVAHGTFPDAAWGQSRHAAPDRSRAGASGRRRHAALDWSRGAAWDRCSPAAWDRCSPAAWDRYRPWASGPYR